MDTHRVMRALAWTGPACILAVLIGWMGLAGFLPPPDPAMSAEQVKVLWQDHTALKTAGMLISCWGGVLLVPFTIAITLALARTSRALAFVQFGFGAFGIVFFAANFLLLATLGFDTTRPADSIKLIHDIGMILTFASVAPFTFQDLTVGAAILAAKDSVFPRWVGYLNIWVGLLFVPATVVPFFNHGPFAWNGLFAFWIPVGVFVVWFVGMFLALRRVPAPVDASRPDLPVVGRA